MRKERALFTNDPFDTHLSLSHRQTTNLTLHHTHTHHRTIHQVTIHIPLHDRIMDDDEYGPYWRVITAKAEWLAIVNRLARSIMNVHAAKRFESASAAVSLNYFHISTQPPPSYSGEEWDRQIEHYTVPDMVERARGAFTTST